MRFAVAKQAGLSEDAVRAMHETDTVASPRHAVMLRWADAFLADPTRIDGRLRAELAAHFSAEAIAELALALGLFMGFSKIAIGLGPPPRDLPVTEVTVPVVPEEP